MTRAEKIAAYETIGGPGFGFIRRFCVESGETEDGGIASRLHLCLARDADPAAEYLELVFEDVQQLHCGDLICGFGALVEIMDVSDRQLEGIAFRVWDEEHQMFSFWCSDLHIAAPTTSPAR